MKILLTAVNAKYIHSNPAVYSLRAYAGEKLREHIEIAEYTINHQLEEILADIYEKNPDVIAFSCYIWNWNMIQELVTELSKVLPGRPIWLGGPEVTYDASEILAKYPQLTGIIIGEGEETFRELIEYYVNPKELREHGILQEIPGLALPSGYTPVRELTDLNRIPFLYDNLEPFKNRIIYYESSRGCPYRCSYCLSSIDKSVRFRDMDVVKKELQFFLDNQVPQVKFVDRTFNCNHAHAMEIWLFIHEHDNGVTNFHFEISADILNEEELTLLNQMRPGLVQLEIGVQTANPMTIKEIRRVMDLDRLEQIVRRIQKGNNIHIHLDLIAGLPFEDYESFGRSFDRVYGMQPQQLQLGFLKVLKGSYMHEKAEDYGLLYLDRPPYEVLSTSWLPYADVLRLKQIEEMVELYYNSNQFTHTLPVLIKSFASPFAMFEALAKFYRRRGYFTQAPARAYRYQVLLDFAEEMDPKQSTLYRELLTFDLYLRENMKSRPDFARDLTPFKEQIRSFYQKEEKEREFLPDYIGYDSRQLAKMTHLEPFSRSVLEQTAVWDMDNKTSQGGYVLFDYKRRNPLTYEARTVFIPNQLIAFARQMQDIRLHGSQYKISCERKDQTSHDEQLYQCGSGDHGPKSQNGQNHRDRCCPH